MARWMGFVGLVVVLSGCATPTTMMVNPRTGDVQQCRAIGQGLEGVSVANASHDKCVEQLRGLGYNPGGELTSEEKAAMQK